MNAEAPTEHPPSKGASAARLSREIVQLHARLYGRGPTKSRSHIHGDYAFCVLEEIFTTAERTLVDAGSGDHVAETRRRFQDAVAEDFKSIATAVTGRKIRVFMSQVDIANEIAVELFLFEPEAGEEATPGA